MPAFKPYSFPLITDEHEMLQQMVTDFAQREIQPIAAELDESGEFPYETVQKMGELGLMGIEVPEEYGGAGMDTLAYVLTMIEVAKVDASHSTILSVNNSLFNYGILKFGTNEQIERWVSPIAAGEKVGCYCLTEPMSGSDASTMRTTAELSADGTYYLLNGRKSWITNGPAAHSALVFAMTDTGQGNKGITAFLVDTQQEGFKPEKKEPKLGIRASATCEIAFENCHVPIEDVLGDVGGGFRIALTVLDAGRIGIAAQAQGIAEAAYDASMEYAKERQAFGGPIGKFQMIQQKIADMKTRLTASRTLIYHAIAAKQHALESGDRYTTEAAMAKLFASETCAYIVDEAVQIHGGMGYSKELPIERYYRDARITRIYEGTSEIQRMVIARNELALR